MKHLYSLTKKRNFQRMLFLTLLVMILSACLPFWGTAVVETEPTTLPRPTAGLIQVTDTPAPLTETSMPTVTTVSAPATETPLPPTPWPETGSPVLGSVESMPRSGCVVYQNGRVTDTELPYVYAGPGTQFGVIGQLGHDRWATGLQSQNGWFEIIIGPGITGWVHETGIGTNGQCGSATVPQPQWPILGSLDTVPANGCVVYQNGQVSDAELPYVRSGPSQQFGIIGQLGRNRWADGLQVQDGWIKIIIGSGATGWISNTSIGTNGQCDSATEPDVPLIINRGAPANNRCVAMRSEASLEAPPVYQTANLDSPLVARLDNWADVQQILPAWVSISIPQGGFGWVEAARVELTIGCGKSGPIRVQFPPGATATTIEGKLPGQAQVEYLFWAAEGQWLEINLTSPENSILFHIEGVSDGQVVKHLLDGESSWQGALPGSQDYRLTLDNAGHTASYSIHLSIENQ